MTERNDGMIIQDHPRADQRNWRPGDTDDEGWANEEDAALKKLIDRKILRTVERLRTLTRLPPEMIAAAIFPYIRIDQIMDMAVYLEEVAKCIGKQMQWKCAECGKDIWFKDDVRVTVGQTGEMGATTTREIRRVRRDAHYCSPACRQKAFRVRKRVTNNPADASPETSRRNGSVIRETRSAVTPLQIIDAKEAA
jgi:hypothetical protein